MTSGAMKQGVPQNVLRARYFCAAQAFWNCPLLPLVALLGLSADIQKLSQTDSCAHLPLALHSAAGRKEMFSR